MPSSTPFLMICGFGHLNQWRMDLQPTLAFDAGFGGEIGHPLKGANIFLAAIRIAAVVELVGAEKDIVGFDALRQTREQKTERSYYAPARRSRVCLAPFRLRCGLWAPRFDR